MKNCIENLLENCLKTIKTKIKNGSSTRPRPGAGDPQRPTACSPARSRESSRLDPAWAARSCSHSPAPARLRPPSLSAHLAWRGLGFAAWPSEKSDGPARGSDEQNSRSDRIECNPSEFPPARAARCFSRSDRGSAHRVGRRTTVPRRPWPPVTATAPRRRRRRRAPPRRFSFPSFPLSFPPCSDRKSGSEARPSPLLPCSRVGAPPATA